MTIDGATDAGVCRPDVEHNLVSDVGGLGISSARTTCGRTRWSASTSLIQAHGAPRDYLPPHAPYLSPIEPCWSKLKTLWRAAQARTRQALDAVIAHVLAGVTLSDARGWFRHCGHALR